MGERPTLPDFLPAIGRRGRLLYAFGHQHIGVTLAAATAEAVVELAHGRDAGAAQAVRAGEVRLGGPTAADLGRGRYFIPLSQILSASQWMAATTPSVSSGWASQAFEQLGVGEGPPRAGEAGGQQQARRRRGRGCRSPTRSPGGSTSKS